MAIALLIGMGSNQSLTEMRWHCEEWNGPYSKENGKKAENEEE